MKLTIEQLADKVNELIAEKNKENPELIKDGRQSSVLSARRIRDYITKGLVDKPVGPGKEKWFDESHVNKLVSLRLLQHNGLSDQYIKTEILNNSSTHMNLSEGYLNSYSNTFGTFDLKAKLNGDESLQNDALNVLNSLQEQSDILNHEKGLLLSTTPDLNPKKNNDDAMQKNAMDFLKSLQQKESALKNPKGSILSGVANSISASGLSSPIEKQYAKQPDVDLLRSLSQSQYRQYNEYPVDDKLGIFLKIDSKTDMALQKKLLEAVKNEIINHNKENKND